MRTNIEQQVMGSVGAIYTARQLTSRVALECYALAAAGLALLQLTWVHKIFANFANVAHQGLGSTVTYLGYAVVHTQLATQLAFIVAAAAGIALMMDLIQSLSRPQLRLSL